ncbi:MAG: hypothetical protein AAFQ52_00930 [Chloroflexota bacterium]
MSNNLDDLSNDPFAESSTNANNQSDSTVRPADPMNEVKDIAGQYMNVAVDRAKDAATDYARNAPGMFLRRMVFSFLLSFTMTNDTGSNSERERLLRRLERGEKVTLHEFFFGQKFSMFSFLRTIVFIVIVIFVIAWAFSTGLVDQFLEMQALTESIQQTTTP